MRQYLEGSVHVTTSQSDEIHTLHLRCCHFLLDLVCFCFVFFHTVPSLQQNIHIKTLADDMVRCSVQLWCG